MSGVEAAQQLAGCGIDGFDGMRHVDRLLRCKLSKSGGQHARAEGDVVGRGVLVGPVADAAAAGDEDHGDGRDAGHEEGVVIGAADHVLGADALVARRLRR